MQGKAADAETLKSSISQAWSFDARFQGWNQRHDTTSLLCPVCLLQVIRARLASICYNLNEELLKESCLCDKLARSPSLIAFQAYLPVNANEVYAQNMWMFWHVLWFFWGASRCNFKSWARHILYIRTRNTDDVYDTLYSPVNTLA